MQKLLIFNIFPLLGLIFFGDFAYILVEGKIGVAGQPRTIRCSQDNQKGSCDHENRKNYRHQNNREKQEIV